MTSSDFQMSGEILKDHPACPAWVRDERRYWVRQSAFGWSILGPVLELVKEEQVQSDKSI